MSKVSDQIEFSTFYRLLNSIKEGDSEKISLLDEKISEFKIIFFFILFKIKI